MNKRKRCECISSALAFLERQESDVANFLSQAAMV